jgi:hypothetical protein
MTSSTPRTIQIFLPANGWIEWKRTDGRTLDEVKRKG